MHGRNTYYIQTITCWVLPPYLSAQHLQGQLLSCSLRMQTLGLRFQIVPRIQAPVITTFAATPVQGPLIPPGLLPSPHWSPCFHPPQ